MGIVVAPPKGQRSVLGRLVFLGLEFSKQGSVLKNGSGHAGTYLLVFEQELEGLEFSLVAVHGKLQVVHLARPLLAFGLACQLLQIVQMDLADK